MNIFNHKYVIMLKTRERIRNVDILFEGEEKSKKKYVYILDCMYDCVLLSLWVCKYF